MSIKRHHAAAIGLAITAAAASTLVFYLATASAQPPPGTTTVSTVPVTSPARRVTIFYERSHRRPAEDRLFSGLVIIDEALAAHFNGECGNAFVGRRRVAGVKRSFFVGGTRNAIVCSWHIPRNAAGEHL